MMLQDTAEEWCVDSQLVEGVNGTLKKQVKVSPHISLKLLSARLTIKRMFGLDERSSTSSHIDNLKRWALHDSVTTSASHRHENTAFKKRLFAFLADNDRWRVLDPADVPLDEYAPPPPPTVLSKDQRSRNAAAAIDQRFAASMLCALKDTLTAMHTPFTPSASFAFEMIIVDGVEDSGHVEYWIPSNTYYSQLWMTKCELEDIVCSSSMYLAYALFMARAA